MKQVIRKSKIWNTPTDILQKIINESSTLVEVLEKLGFDGYNGNHRTLRARIIEDNLDTSILEESRKLILSEKLKNLGKDTKIDNKDIFKENSTYRCGRNLKKRLIENRLKDYKCECCGIGDEWNGIKLSLQLDHINGINDDNRLENLRFICPNCHSQTHTFSGRNASTNKNTVCKSCGCDVTTKSSHCKKCSSKINGETHRKFQISKEELETLVCEKSFAEIGRIYSVSDNAIRKRCKVLGVTIPKFPKGYWLKMQQ
jgi:hypothetical protein